MKLIKALVALLVVAGLVVPVVAIAEDRLSLSGQMRVRGFHEDVDVNDYTSTWADQRLRIAGKIAVAEGVSITFRTDITEGTDWGDSTAGPGRPVQGNGFGHARSGAQQQWDRAHIDVKKGMLHLRAGQQFVGTGGTWAVDTQDSGLSFNLTPADIPVQLYVIVDNDNASRQESDAFLSGVTVKPTFGDVKTRFFLANFNDGEEQNVYLIGAAADATLGAFKLFGELDFFSGDANDAAGIDAFGTQLFVDGAFAATDMITVGGQLFYAVGDDDPTEVQYSHLGNRFNGWDPLLDVGTSLSNEAIDFGSPFNWASNNAGSVGGRIYANFAISENFDLGASAAFLGVEEDAIVDEEATLVAAGAVYKLAENTSLQLQLQHTEVEDKKSSNPDDKIFSAATGLFVNF